MSREQLHHYRSLWPGLMVVACVGFSLGFACIAPLAGFAAAAVLILPRRAALQWTATAWLANQIVGYGLLHYPWTVNSVAWGVGLLAAALLAALAAERAIGWAAGSGRIGATVAGLVAALAAYEATLFVLAWSLLGGTGDYTAAIVAEVLEINAVAFAGLVVLSDLAGRVGLVAPTLAARRT